MVCWNTENMHCLMENSNNNKCKSRLMYILSGMHMAERDYNQEFWNMYQINYLYKCWLTTSYFIISCLKYIFSYSGYWTFLMFLYIALTHLTYTIAHIFRRLALNTLRRAKSQGIFCVNKELPRLTSNLHRNIKWGHANIEFAGLSRFLVKWLDLLPRWYLVASWSVFVHIYFIVPHKHHI